MAKGLPRGRLGGRKPLPVALKELKGTLRKDRELPRLEAAKKVAPRSPTKVPDPPEDLDDDHRAAWLVHAEMVDENGTYRRAYLGAFRKLVQAYVLSEKLLGRIDAEGKGVASWRSADASYAAYISRFGLTPSDNLRLADVARPFEALPTPSAPVEAPEVPGVPDELRPLTTLQ
jgi:hypothetical protein